VEIVKRKENEAKVHAGPPVAMGAHQRPDMGGSGGPSLARFGARSSVEAAAPLFELCSAPDLPDAEVGVSVCVRVV